MNLGHPPPPGRGYTEEKTKPSDPSKNREGSGTHKFKLTSEAWPSAPAYTTRLQSEQPEHQKENAES